MYHRPENPAVFQRGERWLEVLAQLGLILREQLNDVVAGFRRADGCPFRQRLEVRVHDSGIGIKTEDFGRLFTEFEQLDSGTARRFEGTGLGLSIVRETVESIGGRAWAEFSDDKGSVFAFSLPSRRRQDEPALEEASENH